MSHHNKGLKNDMIRTNNKIVFNVPYSPQTNPIEYINNVVKRELKKQHIMDNKRLEYKLASVLNRIQKSKCKIYENCFKKAYESITTS